MNKRTLRVLAHVIMLLALAPAAQAGSGVSVRFEPGDLAVAGTARRGLAA